MWRHYLSMTARGMARHRLYSLINIVGLAVGLTCIILVILFVRDELSFDQWIPGTRNVYRAEVTINIPGRAPLPLAVIPYPMTAAMRDQIPGVTGATRLYTRTVTVTSGDRQFSQNVDVVDPDFFSIIRLPLVAGNPTSVFRQPESIVLSVSAAKQYFGDADPIGKILTTTAANCAGQGAACPQISLRVTGIVRDLPHNTQLTGDAFIPTTSLANPVPVSMRDNWLYQSGWGYVRLAPGVSPAAVAAAMAPIFDQAATPILRRVSGVSSVRGSQVFSAQLTPFRRVHLDSSRWQNNLTPPGSWGTLYGIGTIGGLILLVACFNFMNLTTARATLREREIALRKVLGAGRGQLVLQFLGEAVLVTLLSLMLALALAEVLLPLFDGLLQRPITLDYATDWRLLLLLGAIAVVTGLVSGSYPALVLSGFRPIAGLRAGGGKPTSSGGLRNLLVVLQFSVSVGMGIAAAVVFRQVSYAREMDLGFRHDDVVIINNGTLTGDSQEAFAQALRANPGVAAVGLSNFLPFVKGQQTSTIQVPGQADIDTIDTTIIDPDYPAAYGISLIAGRLLSASRGADRLHSVNLAGSDPLNEGRDVLINAAAARQLGLDPHQAVGRTLIFNHNHVRIVGVLADAKLQGAREPAVSMIYAYVPSSAMNISVRLRPGLIPQTLAFIDSTWHAFVPSQAIQRWFLDGSFNDLYRVDDRQGEMLGVLAVIAVLIGCLGLYGLAVFTAERRTKEIGIRKVSGARTGDIVKLMLWRISVPVLAANLIAWPMAYGYLQHWLDGYAYRITLNPLYFLAAGIVALLIAWVTIYGNTLRLARTSPLRSLRYE